MTCWSEMSKNKTKMVQSLKIKFQIISKINFNEGQIYKKISNFDYFKNWKFFSYIKVGIENGEKVRKKIEIKFWVEKTLDDGWMGGWVDGWKEGKAGLRIAYSNQKLPQKYHFWIKTISSSDKIQFLNIHFSHYNTFSEQSISRHID